MNRDEKYFYSVINKRCEEVNFKVLPFVKILEHKLEVNVRLLVYNKDTPDEDLFYLMRNIRNEITQTPFRHPYNPNVYVEYNVQQDKILGKPTTAVELTRQRGNLEYQNYPVRVDLDFIRQQLDLFYSGPELNPLSLISIDQPKQKKEIVDMMQIPAIKQIHVSPKKLDVGQDQTVIVEFTDGTKVRVARKANDFTQPALDTAVAYAICKKLFGSTDKFLKDVELKSKSLKEQNAIKQVKAANRATNTRNMYKHKEKVKRADERRIKEEKEIASGFRKAPVKKEEPNAGN